MVVDEKEEEEGVREECDYEYQGAGPGGLSVKVCILL